MTHAWLNLIAAIFTLFSGNEAVEPVQEQTEYIVVERVIDDEIVIETGRGNFIVPKDFLPEEMAKEGTVIEIREAQDEKDRRLADSYARLERMSGDMVIDL